MSHRYFFCQYFPIFIHLSNDPIVGQENVSFVETIIMSINLMSIFKYLIIYYHAHFQEF